MIIGAQVRKRLDQKPTKSVSVNDRLIDLRSKTNGSLFISYILAVFILLFSLPASSEIYSKEAARGCFGLKDKDLTLSWCLPPDRAPRVTVGVKNETVEVSLPIIGTNSEARERWRLAGKVIVEARRLRFALASTAGRKMYVDSSLVAEGAAARITWSTPFEPESVATLTGNVTEGVAVANKLPGTILLGQHLFIAVEHPASTVALADTHFTWRTPVTSDAARVTLAVGPIVEGARFSVFRRYVFEGRSRRLRQFFHYNSWYDIAYAGKRFDELESRRVIDVLTDELAIKRDTPLDGFVLDDGWDDTNTLWRFHNGFPRGFISLAREAAAGGAVIGTWLSPWGGYGDERKQRLVAAAKMHFRENQNGLLLSDARYYHFFSSVVFNMVSRQRVRYLKLDGVGSPLGLQVDDPGLRREFMAFLKLLSALNRFAPNVYLNATVGTFPSPFWLWYVDSIWRGGDDSGQAGEGETRERWLTYRDEQVYSNVVSVAPYFPLDGLMLHGIQYASLGQPTNLDYTPLSFQHEVHSYFATGVNLQELYISPRLLSPTDWDILAESVRWARRQKELFTDSHWVGGDPIAGETYGTAAWRKGKGVLNLRNPSAHERTFCAVLADAIEVPQVERGEIHTLRLKEPWKEASTNASVSARIDEVTCLTLLPFDQRVYDVQAF